MKKLGGYMMTIGGALTAVGMLFAGQMPTGEQWAMLGGAIVGGLEMLRRAYTVAQQLPPSEPPSV